MSNLVDYEEIDRELKRLVGDVSDLSTALKAAHSGGWKRVDLDVNVTRTSEGQDVAILQDIVDYIDDVFYEAANKLYELETQVNAASNEADRLLRRYGR